MAAVMQHIDAFKSKLEKALNEKNKVNDVLAQIEAKSGVKRLYIALGCIALVGLYLMVGYGAQFLCNFIGFIYPAYCSIKAIESSDKNDDTQWLTYWVVYSCFHLVEFFSDIFLFWIPFYWFFKCCFLVWCFSSVPWNGSNFLYTKFIRPFILKHQTKIDSALDKAKGAAMEASDLAKEMASDEVIRRAAASVTKED